MTRVRLRPTPSPAELARLYRTPHQHARFPDHIVRVQATYSIASWLTERGNVVADLSCGDAWIARRLSIEYPNVSLILGDLAPGYGLQGPIEETVEQLTPNQVDVFICSETIEHLDNPDEVLRRIRTRTRRLVLTTPIGNTDPGNLEHLWAWDLEDLQRMIWEAGFDVLVFSTLDVRPSGFPYIWGIWGCR